MMKLYYSPGACSLAAHIILEELKLPYQAIKVDLKTHTVSNEDYYTINPKGSVPALVLENGTLITENLAILLYLAELKPEQKLIPAAGTIERVRCHEWLSFISSELHKAFVPLFVPRLYVNSDEAIAELKQKAVKNISKKLAIVEKQLPENDFAFGKSFSIIDAYLFVFYQWTNHLQIPNSEYTKYAALVQRVSMLPAVSKALADEGLLKS